MDVLFLILFAVLFQIVLFLKVEKAQFVIRKRIVNKTLKKILLAITNSFLFLPLIVLIVVIDYLSRN